MVVLHELGLCVVVLLLHGHVRSLVLLQGIIFVLRYHFTDLLLLSLDFHERFLVIIISVFHLLVDYELVLVPPLIEHIPVGILLSLHLVHPLLVRHHLVVFQSMHLIYELVSHLHIFYFLLGLLLLLLQFNDSCLQLSLLVTHHLKVVICLHHICLSLGAHGTQAG